jgi:signal transduction histidine kinase
VAYHPDRIEVHVDSGAGANTTTGEGRGLAGLRERVRLTGGTLEAGPEGDDRYRLHAVLPFEGQSS